MVVTAGMALYRLLPLLLLMLTDASRAAPADLTPVVGHALICHDAIDPERFKRYLTQHYKVAYRNEGEAWWYKAGAKIFGLKVKELFVSVEQSRFAFLGAVLDDDAKSARKKLSETAALRWEEDGPQRWRAQQGSVLVAMPTGSKLYCAHQKAL